MSHVLLIHDGDVVMNALGMVLEQEGYRVSTGHAVEDMKFAGADLVLLGRHARGIEGQGTVADLKMQLGVTAPVYVFSADEDTELHAHAEHVGADGYICTDWGFRRLLSVVRWAARAVATSISMPAPSDMAFNTLNRVLILDDHEGARRRLAVELRNQGYAVREAGDVESLHSTIAKFDPDLILSDVVMPDVPGDEICRHLKQRMTDRVIPIILMSSLPEGELRVRAERAGADAYFRKQEGLPRLVQLVERILSEIVF